MRHLLLALYIAVLAFYTPPAHAGPLTSVDVFNADQGASIDVPSAYVPSTFALPAPGTLYAPLCSTNENPTNAVEVSSEVLRLLCFTQASPLLNNHTPTDVGEVSPEVLRLLCYTQASSSLSYFNPHHSSLMNREHVADSRDPREAVGLSAG